MIVHSVPPCVYHRRARAIGVAPRTWIPAEDRPRALPGREYVGAQFAHRALVVQQSAFVATSVECPHHEVCVLATICPREVLHAYAAAHGLAELAPVSLRELLHE